MLQCRENFYSDKENLLLRNLNFIEFMHWEILLVVDNQIHNLASIKNI